MAQQNWVLTCSMIFCQKRTLNYIGLAAEIPTHQKHTQRIFFGGGGLKVYNSLSYLLPSIPEKFKNVCFFIITVFLFQVYRIYKEFVLVFLEY